MGSLSVWYLNRIHCWHPSRISFLAPKRLRNPSGRENNGIDRFLILKPYTFLAPLSDPIFGAENAPEPKRKENHGICMFLILKAYTCLAPLSHPIFGSEIAPEPKREENHGVDRFLPLQSYTFLAPLSDPNSEEIYAMVRDGEGGVGRQI